MRLAFALLVLVFLGAAPAAARPKSALATSAKGVWNCTTEASTLPHDVATYRATDSAARAGSASVGFPPPPFILNHGVWFHIFYASNGDGKITPEQIAQQLTAMNQAYGAKVPTQWSPVVDTRIRFYLQGFEYIQNDDLYNSCDETLVKQPYAVSPAIYLNVYTCLMPLAVGVSTLPNSYTIQMQPIPNTNWINGIRIDPNAFAGATTTEYPQYHLGRVLVHEAGHFYGLLHPYTDGCTPNMPNDYVADTPRTADMLTGSCASLRGSWTCKQEPAGNPPDDVANYMLATDDACRDHFTAGQVAYMQASIAMYNPQLLSATADSGSIPPATPAPTPPPVAKPSTCTWSIVAQKGAPVQSGLCQLPVTIAKVSGIDMPVTAKAYKPAGWASTHLPATAYWCVPEGVLSYSTSGPTSRLWGVARCVA